MYAYYFEVDAISGDRSKPLCGTPLANYGHRHDWEHVVVWAQGDQVRYVAASMHGGWEVRVAKDVPFEGRHPKIVYHKTARSTHAMRFANIPEDDNPVENHYGRWFYGGLIDYYAFPSNELRVVVTDTDWSKAAPNIRDNGWPDVLKKSMGNFVIPGFDVNVDEEGSNNRPQGC